MPKKVLVIESDAGFAREISKALEAKGYQVRVTGEGKEGLGLAQDDRPDAIVLCVELPKMSGYSVIQKLKKDDALRAIPVILTSAEATADTFELHKKLKTRAEEYLLKPFEQQMLAQKVASVLGEGEAAGTADEEVVNLEEEVAVDPLGGARPPQDDSTDESGLPPLELSESRDDRARSGRRGTAEDDEDMKLLDDAFQSLSGEAPRNAPARAPDEPLEAPLPEDDLAAAAASLPDMEAPAAPGEVNGVADEADALLASLVPEMPLPAPRGPQERPARPAASVRAASAQALRAAGIPLLDPEPAPAAPARESRPGKGSDKQLDDLKRRAEKAEADLRATHEAARQSAAEAQSTQEELASLRERAEAAERDAEEKAGQISELTGKIDALQRELEGLRTELVVARGEADGARGEVEKRTTDLRKRVSELDAQTGKNEERLVKAYQRIKDDEKLREKVRKALAVAMQLLEEAGHSDPRHSAREG